MRVIARDVHVGLEPAAGEGAVGLHALGDHDDDKIAGARNVVALLHHGLIDHLAAEKIEMYAGSGRCRHAQCDDAGHDRRADHRLVEHGNLRRDDSVRAQTLQSPLHGSGGEADLCADGFGDTPSVVLVEIQDFAVNAVQCRPLKCG